MDTEKYAGHLIRRLHQQSTAIFQTEIQAAGFDLTSVQFAALDCIAQHPGIDQASLAIAIAFDRATIGGVIDRLERKGLVQRTVNAEDRRARNLTLTVEGEHTLTACKPVVIALQTLILAPLDAHERETFQKLAQKSLGLGAPHA